MRRHDPWWPLLAASAVAGCAAPAAELAPAAPDRPWQPATREDGAIIPGPGGATTSAAGYVLPPDKTLPPVPPGPALDPGRAYTLPELIDIAQASHPETRVAWATAKNAALAVGVAESAYLPHVAANVLGGYMSTSGQTSAQGFGVEGSGSATGMLTTVSLLWLLFDFGQRDAVVEAARQASVATNIAFTGAHQRVIYEVCVAYYAHAAAKARVAATEKSLANAREVEAAADDRFHHGIGTVIEVAQAHQATAQAQLAQVQARGAAQDTYQGLVAAMGVSPLATIRVADLPQRPLPPAFPQAIDRLVTDAVARRPDVLAAYAGQKAAAAGVQAAEASFSPKVFASATGGYNPGNLSVTAIPPIGNQGATLNISNSHWGAAVLLGVTVPLYDGQLRNSLVGQARSNADKAAATFERVRAEAVRQIVVAQNGVQTNLAAYEASTALADAARITFDAALDAYRHGVGTLTEATAAETQLLAARNAASDAYSSALSAAVTLAFATGTLGAAPAGP